MEKSNKIRGRIYFIDKNLWSLFCYNSAEKGARTMKICHKITNGTLYIALFGELDESCAVYVRGKLDMLFCTPKLTKVVLDLAGVTFMDSTGIGILIGRYKVLKAKNLPLLLASPSAVVDKLLHLSGIYELMPKINY